MAAAVGKRKLGVSGVFKLEVMAEPFWLPEGATMTPELPTLVTVDGMLELVECPVL